LPLPHGQDHCARHGAWVDDRFVIGNEPKSSILPLRKSFERLEHVLDVAQMLILETLRIVGRAFGTLEYRGNSAP